MKERPILFSGAMIRAILADQKTQTRRVVKPIPQMVTDKRIVPWEGDAAALMRLFDQVDRVCPYGQPGDRLWVREAWRTVAESDDLTPRDLSSAHRFWYEADAPHQLGYGKLRPSIHMPRIASRILLEIVSVRVERLQDISEADAEAEGCERLDSDRDERDWKICPQCGGTRLHSALGGGGGVIFDCDCRECDTYVKRYRHLWDSINGDGSWAANPWVWVVEFKRVEEQPR